MGAHSQVCSQADISTCWLFPRLFPAPLPWSWWWPPSFLLLPRELHLLRTPSLRTGCSSEPSWPGLTATGHVLLLAGLLVLPAPLALLPEPVLKPFQWLMESLDKYLDEKFNNQLIWKIIGQFMFVFNSWKIKNLKQ